MILTQKKCIKIRIIIKKHRKQTHTSIKLVLVAVLGICWCVLLQGFKLKFMNVFSVLTYCGCHQPWMYLLYIYIYILYIKQIIHQATRLVVIVIIFIVVSGSGVDSQPEDRYPEWQSNLTRTHLNPERKKQCGLSDGLHWKVFHPRHHLRAYVYSLK